MLASVEQAQREQTHGGAEQTQEERAHALARAQQACTLNEACAAFMKVQNRQYVSKGQRYQQGPAKVAQYQQDVSKEAPRVPAPPLTDAALARGEVAQTQTEQTHGGAAEQAEREQAHGAVAEVPDGGSTIKGAEVRGPSRIP